jgi:hypothetical protein
MRITNSKRGAKLGSKVKFQGISSDAKTLNVSTSYLWCCLTGRRRAQSIVDAYWNLKRDQARALLAETEKAA